MVEHDGCNECVHFFNDADYEKVCSKCNGTEVPDSDEYFSKPDLWESETDNPVNHPTHYCREGGMESIDEMLLVFGVEAVKNFCLCNVWKYRYRAADKNGAEDLKKSDWYMNKYKELCEDELSQHNA